MKRRMRRRRPQTALFVLGTLATLAAPVSGQSERSPVLAGALELFVPTAGFAYAGDWERGLLPNAVRIGSVVGIVATDACVRDNGNTKRPAACATLGATLLV
jgi:hypothetical protein